MKRTKLKKNPVVRTNTEAIKSIYKLNSKFSDSAYLSIVIRGKTPFIRFTFCEFSGDLKEHFPVSAVIMEASDVQSLYNHMGVHLQKLRELKLIP